MAKNTINKNALATQLAAKTGMSQKDSGKIINTLFGGKVEAGNGNGLIADALAGGAEVSLPGFGRFYSHNRPARVGLNPQTKQKINIPARNVPKFSAGKLLKEATR
jgi:DNA-binding protein HU-beta